MGSIPPELSLNFRPSFVPKTIGDLLIEVSMIGSVSEKVARFDDFVKRLEEEMRKIEAFKRELPLSMLLLNDAIYTLKEKSIQCIAPNNQPVLEEFIPLKKNVDDEPDGTISSEKDSIEKKSWMSTVQLWNTEPESQVIPRSELSKINKEDTKSTKHGLFESCENVIRATSFVPFKKTRTGLDTNKDCKEYFPVQGLSLLTPGIKSSVEDSNTLSGNITCIQNVSSSASFWQRHSRNGLEPPQQHTSRKQRRCWSPDLHHQFVKALQQLGGSHAATPKQIRELMQVDGLTNDEVKSHLQKYRLHSRRLTTAAPAGSGNQSVVMTGSLWESPPLRDQCGESEKSRSSESGSPQGPLELAMKTGSRGHDGSMEDEEDTNSWRSHIHNSGKVYV